ncbi:MAG: type VI secretion system ATPase TssH [Candidatus Dactylopiibacterium sp.]|nr:type VI secretion system ATPase TssH [Candidatus Dactylopiibacterium sp.]
MPHHESARLLRRLSPYCAQALESAAGLAQTRAHAEIAPEHWLLKLLEPGDGDLPLLIRQHELDLDALWQGLLSALERLPHALHGKPALAHATLAWMREAWLLASLRSDARQIRSAHLLQALQDHPQLLGAREAWPLLSLPAAHIEDAMGRLDALSVESLPAAPGVAPAGKAREDTAPGAPANPPGATAEPPDALRRFALDLTARALAGQIDPVFGRDGEIRQMLDILARRRKNNPILVGDPGVGKTALVEGLALRIAAGEVPRALRPVRVFALDMGLLQAGAGVKGEFEQRLKNVIDAVQGLPVPALLFIDEAHTLIGAGNSAGGADAANLLKPALARGELRTIAATTWSEYKQYFERDAALERRFQMVKVDEPDDAAASLMLRGLQARYAAHHGVHIRDEAIVAAVQLSRRYLTGRQLPDKAVDLIDTAAARVGVSLDTEPAQIETLRSRLAGLQTEMDALQADAAQGVAGQDARVRALQTDHDDTQARLTALVTAHAGQRELVTQIRAASAPPAGETATPPRPVEALREQLAALQRDHLALAHADVDADIIASVVADWTGIPVENLRQDEHAALLDLEYQLGQRVVGQDEAIAHIAGSLRAARTGLRTSDGPGGVFLLAGPSGVGKTETALALADRLFGGRRALVTINLSEYQEAHTVSQLKGSPPGYVGYGRGGVLTEAVRQHPYSIVLLDEIEKAHRDVANLFHQVFDRGFMRDGEGREIDFRNTVVLMTSNLGGEQILALHDDASAPPDWKALEDCVRPVLRDHFQAALLARIQPVFYRPLDQQALRRIVDIKLRRVGARLAGHHRTLLEYDEAVCEGFAAACGMAGAGARTIDHLLDRQVLPTVSQAMLRWRQDQGRAPTRITLKWDEAQSGPDLLLE